MEGGGWGVEDGGWRMEGGGWGYVSVSFDTASNVLFPDLAGCRSNRLGVRLLFNLSLPHLRSSVYKKGN